MHTIHLHIRWISSATKSFEKRLNVNVFDYMCWRMFSLIMKILFSTRGNGKLRKWATHEKENTRASRRHVSWMSIHVCESQNLWQIERIEKESVRRKTHWYTNTLETTLMPTHQRCWWWKEQAESRKKMSSRTIIIRFNAFVLVLGYFSSIFFRKILAREKYKRNWTVFIWFVISFFLLYFSRLNWY